MGSKTLGCLSFWAKSNLIILLTPDFYLKLFVEKSWLPTESVAGQSRLRLPGATGTLFPADTEIKRRWNKTITLGDILPSGICSLPVFREIILNNFQWFHQETKDWVLWSCQEMCSHHIRMQGDYGYCSGLAVQRDLCYNDSFYKHQIHSCEQERGRRLYCQRWVKMASQRKTAQVFRLDIS